MIYTANDYVKAAFGWIMFITVVILPNLHSFLSPNQEELLLWERAIRTVTFQPQQSPYENWARPALWMWIPAKTLYHTFAAFTHVISQIKLHTSAAEKYENFTELTKRWTRFKEMAHEQKFQYCDALELGKSNFFTVHNPFAHGPWPHNQFLQSIILVKLKALQIRANIYVVYYGIFSKSRLKFVMMEDALQYGTQDCFKSISPKYTNIPFKIK